MAKQKKNTEATTETPVPNNTKTDEVKTEEQRKDEVNTPVQNQATETAEKGNIIEPIAFQIILKSVHPQASYGRCGYRFNKDAAVEIARADLSDEQVLVLFADPYLEVVPMTEQ